MEKKSPETFHSSTIETDSRGPWRFSTLAIVRIGCWKHVCRESPNAVRTSLVTLSGASLSLSRTSLAGCEFVACGPFPACLVSAQVPAVGAAPGAELELSVCFGPSRRCWICPNSLPTPADLPEFVAGSLAALSETTHSEWSVVFPKKPWIFRVRPSRAERRRPRRIRRRHQTGRRPTSGSLSLPLSLEEATCERAALRSRERESARASWSPLARA